MLSICYMRQELSVKGRLERIVCGQCAIDKVCFGLSDSLYCCLNSPRRIGMTGSFFNESVKIETFFEFHWTQMGDLISLKSVSSVNTGQKHTVVGCLEDHSPILLLYFKFARFARSCLSNLN